MRRRTFLLGSAAIAGSLVVGFREWAGSYDRAAQALVQRDGEHLIAGWVKIASDDRVTVYVPHVDMGQGTHTALAMLLADELDADWSKVHAERAPGDKAFANQFLARGWILEDRKFPVIDGAVSMAFEEISRFINLQITGGSTAVRMTGRFGMRQVGAAARAMLVQAAAAKWNVPAGRLAVRDGIIADPDTRQSLRFGELVAEAAKLPVPADMRLKRPDEWRLIGTSPKRLDIPAKTNGSFHYGIDLTLPDMVHAALKAAPVHGGRLVKADPAPAQSMPGVVKVVLLERALAVVAKSWWQARQALDALTPEFSTGGPRLSSSADIAREQDRVLASGKQTEMVSIGAAESTLRQAGSGNIIKADYRAPYLHQAAMEPLNITAQFKDGKLTVWGGEQDALGAKARLMQISGLGSDAVTVNGLPAGGAFGRRSADSADYFDHLVPLAKAMAPLPVKLIYSREEEFTHGAYRPSLMTHIEAALGDDGLPRAWSQAYLYSGRRNEAFTLPYNIPHQSIRSIDFVTHVNTGSWRSVAHTQHGFWTESFVDELAHAVGRDPYEYRMALLSEGSRARRVLQEAAESAQWTTPLAKGRGRGMALVESFGSIVAEVVEVAITSDGAPRVERVTAVVDCGTVVHPDNGRAQIEGAITMALSAALFEEITIADGAVAERNFSDYRLATMADMPEIEVHFVTSDAMWGGLGEPGVPPLAPALANAIFAASGKRIRQLPIMKAWAST